MVELHNNVNSNSGSDDDSYLLLKDHCLKAGHCATNVPCFIFF